MALTRVLQGQPLIGWRSSHYVLSWSPSLIPSVRVSAQLPPRQGRLTGLRLRRGVRWFHASGGSLAPVLLALQTTTVFRFHRRRKSPCALATAHPVAHVRPVKSASPPAFRRARLPEECEVREESAIGMLGQSPHLIGGILWIQNPMRGTSQPFLRAPSSGMIGMSAPAGQPV